VGKAKQANTGMKHAHACYISLVMSWFAWLFWLTSLSHGKYPCLVIHLFFLARIFRGSFVNWMAGLLDLMLSTNMLSVYQYKLPEPLCLLRADNNLPPWRPGLKEVTVTVVMYYLCACIFMLTLISDY
jgi:hypothetical protein